MARTPTTTLRVAKIGPPQAPRKVSIEIEAAVAAELDRYAEAYTASYGESIKIEALIPHMLASYLASDRGFANWKKTNTVRSETS